jgi:hypothetical protein
LPTLHSTPDELQAIQALQIVLLGEELPAQAPTKAPTQAPNPPKMLRQPAIEPPIQAAAPTPIVYIKEELIYMWNPIIIITTHVCPNSH